MPAEVKPTETTAQSYPEAPIEVTGEMAPPPSGIQQLSRYMRPIPPIPSILPGTPLEHTGAATPVTVAQTGSIHVNDKPLTKEEKIGFMGSLNSRDWQIIWDQRERDKKQVQKEGAK